MLKNILIGIGVLAVVLFLVFMYANNRNRTLSPPGFVELDANNLHIEINYSRTSVRNRLIFGAAADGALQPYGSYWRLGANEATEITLTQAVTFNGVALKAGTYRLYAVPDKNIFRIGVNTGLGKWGAWWPVYCKDLFTTEVPVMPCLRQAVNRIGCLRSTVQFLTYRQKMVRTEIFGQVKLAKFRKNKRKTTSHTSQREILHICFCLSQFASSKWNCFINS